MYKYIVKRNYLKKCSDEQIVQSIAKSNSASEAILALGYNATERYRIKQFAEENNIDISHFSRVNQRTYSLNEKYFEDLNSNSVYWLGFIMADGNIRNHKHEHSLKVHLAIKDENHLKVLKDDLGYNGSLRYHDAHLMTAKGKTHWAGPSTTLQISSKTLIHSLLNLCVLPNKTQHGCKISEKIPEELIRHFIRGYFDGDGSIVITRQTRNGKLYKPQLQFFLLGDYNFLSAVKNIMVDKIGLNDCKISARAGIYCIKWAGNTQCSRIYHWLYDDSERFLPRKKQKFDEVIKPLQTD